MAGVGLFTADRCRRHKGANLGGTAASGLCRYAGNIPPLLGIVLAFFWVEHVSQHNMVPLFFPDGGLSKVKGVGSDIDETGHFPMLEKPKEFNLLLKKALISIETNSNKNI